MLPFVSIVVTAFNDHGLIRDCLASLQALSYPLDRREVLLVDRGSTDATVSAASRFPVACLSSRGSGIASARNLGIAAGHGELVAFTDPDCVVAASWLEELVRGFEGSAVGAVAGAIIPYPPSTLAERYAARRMSHSQLRPLEYSARPFALAPNLAFRRDALERTGGFDGRFPGGGFEDADLCWRFRDATGLDLRYAPRAVVLHRYRSSVPQFLVQHYRYGYGLALLRHKYRHEPPFVRDRPVARRTVPARLRRDHQGLAFTFLDLVRSVGQRAGILHAKLSLARPAVPH